MRINVKDLKNNMALSGTVIVTLGLFFTNVLSYVLQIVLGRLLTVPEYGTFIALFSLFSILSFPNNVLTTALIKITSELKALDKFDKLTLLFKRFVLIGIVYGSIFILLILLFKDSIASSLNIHDSRVFIPFAIYIGLSFIMTIPSAYLQGMLRFKAFAFFLLTGSTLRLLLPSLFVYLGFNATGVFLGMDLSLSITFIVSLLLLRKNFRPDTDLSLKPYYKKVLMFSVPVLFVNVGMVLLNNIDVLLFKHYFSPETAGIYSGVVTTGKILLFGAGTVSVVMFPQISELFTKGGDYVGRFKDFLKIQLLLISGGLFTFSVFPQLVTTVMFGEKFILSSIFLPRFAIFISLYVLINFMVMFFLAINKTSVYLLQIPVIIAQFILIYLFHNSIEQIININIIVSMVLLVFIVLYYIKYVGKHYNSSL